VKSQRRMTYTHWIWNWMSSERLCIFWRWEKSLSPAGNRSTVYWLTSAEPSHYADCTTQATEGVNTRRMYIRKRSPLCQSAPLSVDTKFYIVTVSDIRPVRYYFSGVLSHIRASSHASNQPVTLPATSLHTHKCASAHSHASSHVIFTHAIHSWTLIWPVLSVELALCKVSHPDCRAIRVIRYCTNIP
jgi:hypothetical protein